MIKKYVPPRYPVLDFIAGKGMAVALLLGAALCACGIAFAASTGQWMIAVGAVIAAALVTGLLASYVELVRIIIDTLVPR